MKKERYGKGAQRETVIEKFLLNAATETTRVIFGIFFCEIEFVAFLKLRTFPIKQKRRKVVTSLGMKSDTVLGMILRWSV